MAGRGISLPAEDLGKPALIVFAFSRKAGDQAKAWAEALREDWRGNSRFAYYQVAELEGAPGWIRGFILSGMRGSAPKDLWDRFIVLTRDTQVWEREAGVQAKALDDAYAILLDASGQACWKAHGPLTPALKAELEARAARGASPDN